MGTWLPALLFWLGRHLGPLWRWSRCIDTHRSASTGDADVGYL